MRKMSVLRRLVLMMAGLALLFAAASALAEEAPAGVVTQTSCSIVQSEDYYLVYCFAQVHNNSSETIFLNEGVLSLFNGEQLLAEQEVAKLWPYFISPGEDGYLYDVVAFEPNEDGVVVPNVTGLYYELDYGTVDAGYSSIALETAVRVQEDPQLGVQIVCEMANPTDVEAFDPTVAIGLYAENGALLYTDGLTLHGIGIPAGGKTLLRFEVDDAFIEQWSSYGVTPAEVRVNASFRTDAD